MKLWTGLEDNVRILGLAGGTNHYERVYRRFDTIYRKAGALANPSSPVINPSESFEYRFVKNLMAKAPAVKQAAQQPQFTFNEAIWHQRSHAHEYRRRTRSPEEKLKGKHDANEYGDRPGHHRLAPPNKICKCMQLRIRRGGFLATLRCPVQQGCPGARVRLNA